MTWPREPWDDDGLVAALHAEMQRLDLGMDIVLGPDPGWVMMLPSGKKVLCGEHTDKAQPVWVWWAR
jgi:hypothetical protein